MPTYKLIQRQQLTSPTTVVTFNNLSGYTDLIVKIVARDTRTNSSGDDIIFWLNSDGTTTGKYGYHAYFNSSTSSGTNIQPDFGTNINYGFMGVAASAGNSSPSTLFGSMEVHFPNYATSAYKVIGAKSELPGLNDTTVSTAQSGTQWWWANQWQDTAAISSIKMQNGTTSDFVAGSSFSIYGILKA
jgi:hypothetical protein